MDCSDVRTCNTCDYFSMGYGEPDHCRRLQKKSCNLLYKGCINYSGPLLECESEREQGKTFREWLFGPRKFHVKCGEFGRFWKEKEKVIYNNPSEDHKIALTDTSVIQDPK
jgi:hypothetical protein